MGAKIIVSDHCKNDYEGRKKIRGKEKKGKCDDNTWLALSRLCFAHCPYHRLSSNLLGLQEHNE